MYSAPLGSLGGGGAKHRLVKPQGEEMTGSCWREFWILEASPREQERNCLLEVVPQNLCRHLCHQIGLTLVTPLFRMTLVKLW